MHIEMHKGVHGFGKAMRSHLDAIARSFFKLCNTRSFKGIDRANGEDRRLIYGPVRTNFPRQRLGSDEVRPIRFRLHLRGSRSGTGE